MQVLLTVLVTWLSMNFDLPASYEHPRVELVSAARMAEVRYSRLSAQLGQRNSVDAGNSAAAETGHNVHAIYDDASQTIFLPAHWNGTKPAEISILVHELVHHLQNVSRMEFDCAAEREKSAYRAQAAWLELFGKTLATEFELDPMTILVRSNCIR